MLWLIFLFTVFLNGVILQYLFLAKIQQMMRLVSVFIIGSIVSVSLIYIFASFIFYTLLYALLAYFVSCFLFYLFNLKSLKSNLQLVFTPNINLAIFIIVGFLLSLYIFIKTFSYDFLTGQFLIASNVYSDFGVHIPLIRSFSMGENFPAEVSFFAGKTVAYHFIFDFYTGILEFLGLRIDLAFNILSSFSFLFLLITIWHLARVIFKDIKIAIVSIALFLFNSDLSFINFFRENKLDFSLLSSFWHNSFYSGNGPLGSDTIAVYWNLNTFVNQRQLVFGMLFVTFVVYMLLTQKETRNRSYYWPILLGVLLGLFPLWHSSMFISTYFLLLSFFIFSGSFYTKMRENIAVLGITGFIIALPQLWFITSSSTNPITFQPGFILFSELTLNNFIVFWLWNFGANIILCIFGYQIATPQQKKIFLISLSLFIIPNMLKFSSDMANNHKFINLWIIWMNMFSAYVLVWIFRKKLLGKLLALLFLVLLTMSGVLNFLVIKNDVYAKIQDYPGNNFMVWMRYYIPSRDIVISNGEIYDPASLLGKRVFLGRAYYVETYGGFPYERAKQVNWFFSTNNLEEMKKFIKLNEIRYIILYKNNFAKNSRNFDEKIFKENFRLQYEDRDGIIFKT